MLQPFRERKERKDPQAYIPRLSANLGMLLVMEANAMSRQVQHLVPHTLRGVPIQFPDMSGQSGPVSGQVIRGRLSRTRRAGIVAVQEGQTGLGRDFAIGHVLGPEVLEDAGHDGELPFRLMLLRLRLGLGLALRLSVMWLRHIGEG